MPHAPSVFTTGQTRLEREQARSVTAVANVLFALSTTTHFITSRKIMMPRRVQIDCGNKEISQQLLLSSVTATIRSLQDILASELDLPCVCSAKTTNQGETNVKSTVNLQKYNYVLQG